MKSMRAILFVLLFFSLSCSFTDRPDLPASDKALAQNRRIEIGGHTITAPAIVFLVSTTRTRIIYKTSSQGHGIALTIDQFLHTESRKNDLLNALAIDVYMDSLRSLQDNKTDIHVSTTDSFCLKLEQPWAKNQCTSGLDDNHKVSVPSRFTLIERTYLQNHSPDLSFYSGGFKSAGEAARLMLEQNKFPNRHCEISDTGNENRLCTCIDKIDENLFIVWIADKAENYPKNYNNIKGFVETELLDKQKPSKNQ